MNQIQFDCPGCGQTIKTPEEAQFERVKCPTCQHEFFPDHTRIVQPAPAVLAAPPPKPPSVPATAKTPTPVTPPSGNLRNCKDCGKTVSVHAESCPHCGSPMKYESKHWTTGRKILLTIVVVAIVLTVLYLSIHGGLIGLTTVDR
jgi:uncharacterized paraquat-inducible protein A